MSIKDYNWNKKVRLNTLSALHTTFSHQLICPERFINTDYYSSHRVMINKRNEGPDTPLYDLHQQSLFVLIHVALLHDYCCTQILKIEARKKKKKKYQLLSSLLVGAVATHPGWCQTPCWWRRTGRSDYQHRRPQRRQWVRSGQREEGVQGEVGEDRQQERCVEQHRLKLLHPEEEEKKTVNRVNEVMKDTLLAFKADKGEHTHETNSGVILPSII